MKRLFANLTLVAVLGVFVLSLAASLRGPDVPVCCLPGGKHRCLQHPAGTGPSFKSKTDACPYLSRLVATGWTGLHQEKPESERPGSNDYTPVSPGLSADRMVLCELCVRGPPPFTL